MALVGGSTDLFADSSSRGRNEGATASLFFRNLMTYMTLLTWHSFFCISVIPGNKRARPERNMMDRLRGDLIMRAAILVAGCFLVASSTFAAEPQANANTAMKPVVVALAP